MGVSMYDGLERQMKNTLSNTLINNKDEWCLNTAVFILDSIQTQ